MCCENVNQNWGYKESVLLLNNLNHIKKIVEDISVHTVLGCEVCSVVIYVLNYKITILQF